MGFTILLIALAAFGVRWMGGSSVAQWAVVGLGLVFVLLLDSPYPLIGGFRLPREPGLVRHSCCRF